MKLNIRNIDINYVQYGEGKKDVVLLHGWGQNIQMMNPIGEKLQKSNKITIVDLPGFGESDEPKETWNMDKYSHFLESFLDEVKVKKPIVIGHSFGGRLAIRYSAHNPIEKMVLFCLYNLNRLCA